MRVWSVLLGVVILAAGCAADQEEVVSGGDDTPSETTRPGGGGEDGELVVSVEVGGGFVMVGSDFRTVPSAVVYRDGRTFSPGAVAAIYPGPAVPPVAEGRIEPSELEHLVQAAEDAGLLDDVEEDFGQPLIADATTTTVRVVAGGEEHVTSVYALDATLGLPGIGPEQQQARERVAGYVDLVIEAVHAGSGDLYVPSRYRLLPLAPGPAVDLAVPPDEQPWPFPEVALAEGECTAVAGEQAAELGEVLAGATEITRWRTGAGETFVLAVRPVLPHEPGCPE